MQENIQIKPNLDVIEITRSTKDRSAPAADELWEIDGSLERAERMMSARIQDLELIRELIRAGKLDFAQDALEHMLTLARHEIANTDRIRHQLAKAAQ